MATDCSISSRWHVSNASNVEGCYDVKCEADLNAGTTRSAAR